MKYLLELKPDILADLKQQLESIRKQLYEVLPSEKGILLRPHIFKKHIKDQQKKVKLKELRLRKRKCPFSGRVGEKKEISLKASKLKISQYKTV